MSTRSRDHTLRLNPSVQPLLWVIACTIAFRSFVLWWVTDEFQSDPDAYQAIAKTIQESGVFGLSNSEGVARAIAYRPPLYPWLLSWCMSAGALSTPAIAACHVVLAALTAGFVFLATRQAAILLSPQISTRASNGLGGIAALLTTVDPILVQQSTAVMTETLAVSLTAAVIWLWMRWHISSDDSDQTIHHRWTRGLGVPIALGVLLALAYLCRPTFVVWAALLAVATVARFRDRRGAIAALMVTAVVSLAVTLWTARNVRAIGHPVWATTHGGYTLLLANNESFYQYLGKAEFGAAWDADAFLRAYEHRYEADPREASFWQRDWQRDVQREVTSEVLGPVPPQTLATEYEDDRLCYESAMATIKRNPATFVWSAIVRVAWLWSPFPHQVPGRSNVAVALVAGFYITLFTAVIATTLRHRRVVFQSRWWAIWLLAFSLTGVHAVYWSNLRMRAPVVPGLSLLAALCVIRRPD